MSFADSSAVQASPMSIVPVYTASPEQCDLPGHAKIMISLQEQRLADGTNFPASLNRTIGKLQEMAANRAGAKAFDWLAVHVELPASEGRGVVDTALKTLCASDIIWDTLEVIMPKHPLIHEDHDMEDISKNKEGIRDRVLARFANRCVVYEGAEENVPWPWYRLPELSCFLNRSLTLKQQVTVKHFRELVANAGLAGSHNGLELHVGGVIADDNAELWDPGDAHSAGLSRIQELDLGRVEKPLTLKSLLLAGHVYKSITVLKAEVMQTVFWMDLRDAINICGPLKSAKLVCGTSQFNGLRTACEAKVVNESLSSDPLYVEVIAKETKVETNALRSALVHNLVEFVGFNVVISREEI